MPAIYPYGASLNVACTTSNKRGMTIDAYMSSSKYTSKEDYIGKGLSYFIESSVQPMSMTYECTGINGDLVEIDTNLRPTINKSYTEDGDTIIKKFTIDNFEWFYKNPEQEEISINKKINQVKIKLDPPYYNNSVTFKKGNSTINYSTKTSDITNSIFCFDVNSNITVGTEIKATYNAKIKGEENLVTYKYNNDYSRINTSKSWIDNEIEIYQKDENNIVTIENTDIENRTLILNDNQIIENEKLIVSYYIDNEVATEEFLSISYNENEESYIQLSNMWIEAPQIYKVLENSVTIDRTYSSSKRIRFKRTEVPSGTLIKIKYKNINNEDKIEYLTAEYISTYGSSYTNIFTKEKFQTNPDPIAFKIEEGDEIYIKQENLKDKVDLDNRIVYLNNNEIENIDFVKVIYHCPKLKQEIVNIVNNNQIVLSDFWLENFLNKIKIYKVIQINDSSIIYNSTNKYIEFSNAIIPEGKIVLVNYNYSEKITNKTYVAEEFEEKTTYEGNISALSNSVIIKCSDLQNNEISYGITNNNNIIFVNKKYNEQNIIVYYKEKPYINLCCNNVKVECDFFIYIKDNKEMWSNFETLGLYEYNDDCIIVKSKSNKYAILNRYITVHWNKEEKNNSCIVKIGEKDSYYISRKQVFLKSDGTYGETAQTDMAWSGNEEEWSNDEFTVPPLNGSTPISKNSNIKYKNFYKLLYNIRPVQDGSSRWERGTKFFIKNTYPIYKENGMIQYISGTRRINTENNAPIPYNLPIWGNEKVFYKTEDGYYISPASGGLLITGWAISAQKTTADSQGFKSFQANYNKNYNIRTGPGGKYGIAQFIKTSDTVTVTGEQEDDEGNKWYCCIFQARTQSGESTTATGWVISDGISR